MRAAAQVVRINLLPYRHAARRRRVQELLWLLGGGAMLGLLLALGAGAWLQLRLDDQALRQEGWRSAMRQVDGVLAGGQRLQREAALLAARRQAIGQLQAQRNAWVAMLGALAQAVPAGVALHGVRQEASGLRLQGQAATQDAVAALLLALAQSAPQSAPELLEVREGAGAVEWTIRLAWTSPAAPAPPSRKAGGG